MTDYDAIILGGGAAGLFCAAKAGQNRRRVLVLEKTDLVGGTTAISGGVMWIPANRYLAEAGITDSEEQAIAYMDAVVGDHDCGIPIFQPSGDVIAIQVAR